MNKPSAVLFAGSPGSSQTQVAYFLSWSLDLPIISNDAMRREIRENSLDPALDPPAYFKLRDDRLEACLKLNRSFIYDASIDRSWSDKKTLLEKHNYSWFIIGFDLSKEYLEKLTTVVGSLGSADDEARWYDDQQKFLANYSDQINLKITDQNFSDRTTLALEAVKAFLAG